MRGAAAMTGSFVDLTSDENGEEEREREEGPRIDEVNDEQEEVVCEDEDVAVDGDHDHEPAAVSHEGDVVAL